MNIKLLVITLLASVFGGSLEAAPNTLNLTNSGRGTIWVHLTHWNMLKPNVVTQVTDLRSVAPGQTQEIPFPPRQLTLRTPTLAIWNKDPQNLRAKLMTGQTELVLGSGSVSEITLPDHLVYSVRPDGMFAVARRGFKFVWNGTKLIPETK